ncbi:MAG TPA: hypothetical protein VM537_09045 [Anaerolineae bacterium]|nr:hypothetical protein [Anaerolineae bacterium]
MAIRVPLIAPVSAAIYRLDIQGTWATDPPGSPTEGYNYLLREPVVSRTAGVRTVTRAEMAVVLVPCQVEVQSYQQLSSTFGGDSAVTEIALVTHRRDLESLSLLDANRHCILKPGDRISHIERTGRTVQTFNKPLYIYEIRPKSWGFGPDGYDLEVIYTTYRSSDPRRQS